MHIVAQPRTLRRSGRGPSLRKKNWLLVDLSCLLTALPEGDVTVFHGVGLTDLLNLTLGLDCGFGSVLLEVSVLGDFTRDEFLLEIGVNDTGRFRSGDAISDGPSSNFIDTTCEVSDQVQRCVTGCCDLAQCGSGTDGLAFLDGGLVTHVVQSLLERY